MPGEQARQVNAVAIALQIFIGRDGGAALPSAIGHGHARMAGGIGAQKRIKIGDGKQTDITIRRAAGQKLPSRAFAKRKDLFRRKITKSQAPRSFAERSCHAGGRTSGSASATACLITRVGIRHGLLPRAAAIARAIPGIGIGQARAAPRATPIAGTIAGIGIGQSRAARTTTATPRPIRRISIGDHGNERGRLERFGAGGARSPQKGRGGRQLQDQ